MSDVSFYIEIYQTMIDYHLQVIYRKAWSTLTEPSTDEITSLIRVVLENNYFKFENRFYLQKIGTAAMGSFMSSTYASL